jgi:hypothetical protein
VIGSGAAPCGYQPALCGRHSTPGKDAVPPSCAQRSLVLLSQKVSGAAVPSRQVMVCHADLGWRNASEQRLMRRRRAMRRRDRRHRLHALALIWGTTISRSLASTLSSDHFRSPMKCTKTRPRRSQRGGRPIYRSRPAGRGPRDHPCGGARGGKWRPRQELLPRARVIALAVPGR